jgi:cardiolipin synthase
MATSAALLDACARFAAEVSPEATAHVVRLLETDGATRAGVGLSGDAAQRYGELMSAWSNSPSKVPASDVANLLCGAAHAVAAERRRQRVELVWSGPSTVSSTLRSTGPALLELIRSARESVYLVTFAAYKVPEVAEALADAARRKVRLVFVLETDAASGGKVDFDPLPHLAAELAEAVEVYAWPMAERAKDSRGRHGTLHAKFAVADRQRLLVSSANLTEFAFNLNIELGVLLTGGSAPAEAAAHLDRMIQLGVFRRQLFDATRA